MSILGLLVTLFRNHPFMDLYNESILLYSARFAFI